MKPAIYLCLLGAVLLYQVSAENDVIVKNLKLYVNCEEFIIKSFCYSPTPLGRTNNAAQNMGGYCSPRKNPFGVIESACDDEDMFDGSMADPARTPPGPPNGWWESVWLRDMPVMVESGANTIRLYHVSPWTRNYTIQNLGKDGIVAPLGKEHVKFMDMAESFGLKVIFPLPAEENKLRSYSQETMFQLIRNVVDEVGNHPALLMWAMGNELPLDDFMINLLNTYMAYTRQYTLERWNRFIPITHAVVDLPTSYDKLAATLDVDVFSTNAGYRGFGFSDLWDGTPRLGFSGWRTLSQNYSKPVFISEVGWHSANNQITNDVPDWFNQIYKDFVHHIDDGCVGMAFFEYSDEEHKADPLQKTMGAIAWQPTIGTDGKSSIEQNVWLPDTLIRKVVFNRIKEGTFEGQPYNFNADIHTTFLQRPKSVLPAAECVPTPTTGPRTSWGTTTTESSTGSQATTGAQSTGTQSSGTQTSSVGTTSPNTTAAGTTDVETTSQPVTSSPVTTSDDVVRASSASMMSYSIFAVCVAAFYSLFL